MTAVNDDATPTGMLHLRTWLPAELHEPFSTWCDTHHLEQLVVPGFRRVRRFSLVRSEVAEPPRYLTIYDLDRLEVLESDEYDAYRARSTGLPEFLQGHLRAARTDAWLVASVPARAGLVPGGAGSPTSSCPRVPTWPTGSPSTAWPCSRPPVPRRPVCCTPPPASRSWWWSCPMPPSPTGSTRPRSPCPTGLDDGIGWGLYRLDFTATPDS